MRLMTKKEMKQFLKEVDKRKKFREALLQLVKNRSMKSTTRLYNSSNGKILENEV